MGEQVMWPKPIIHLLSNHISDMETGFVVNVCTSRHTTPRIYVMPSLHNTPRIYVIPSLHTTPRIYVIPSLHTTPRIYVMPSLHTTPRIYVIPSLHNTPRIYVIPSLHTTPRIYVIPSLHTTPRIYVIPSLHTTPRIYVIPSLHTTPRIYVIPSLHTTPYEHKVECVNEKWDSMYFVSTFWQVHDFPCTTRQWCLLTGTWFPMYYTPMVPSDRYMISHVLHANGDHKSQLKASQKTIMVRTLKEMLYVINIWNNICPHHPDNQ